MYEYITVITTCATKAEAQVLTKKLITAKLAACIQIDEVESFFHWDGECCHETEHRLMLKSKSDLYKEIETFILENHSYDTPEIIAQPIIEASQDYLAWIDENVQAKS